MARQSNGFYLAMVLRLFVLLFAVVVMMKIYVAREESPGASVAQAVSFPSAVRVADVTLPAGRYRVKRTAAADRQFVVFTTVRGGKAYQVLCRVERLSATAGRTEQQFVLGPSGEPRLVALTLEGEPFKHVFWDEEQGR